jgi:TP901 family phage tail tape measure protein
VIKAGVAYVEVAYDPASIAALRAETKAQGELAAKTFGQSMSSAGKRLTSVGHSLSRNLTLPIGIAAAASVKFAVDFQRSMELVHTQAGASQQEVVKMSKAVLDLAPAVATGPNELAKALYHIESVGVRGAAALDVLHAAAIGAKVGNADLEATTNALTAVQVNNLKGTTSMTQGMATLNAIVGVGNMRMNDLASSMSSGILTSAKTFGLSLQSVGAALATMTDAGTPAQEAATRLRMSFSLLAAPTSKAQKVLATIGLSATDLAYAMRKPDGLVAAVQLLSDHLKGLDKVHQGAVLSGAFGGGKSSATIMALVNNLGRLQTKYDAIGAGVSKYGNAVKKTTETDQFKFQQSLAQLQSTGIQIGATLLPVLVTLADDVGSVAKAFSGLSPTMQKVIIDSVLVLAALGPILTVGGNVAKVIGGAAKAFSLLTTSSTGVAAATAPIATGLEGVGTAAVGAEAGAVGAGVGLTGLGVAAAVAAPLLITVGALIWASATATDGMANAMQGARTAADNLGTALQNQKNGNVDLKQSVVDRASASKTLAGAEKLLTQLVRDGKKGTDEYAAALRGVASAQIAVTRETRHYYDALHQNRLNKDAVRAEMTGVEQSFTKIAHEASIAATAQNRYGLQTGVAAKTTQIFKQKTNELAAAEGALATKYKQSDPLEAQKHRRLELLSLAAHDLTIKLGQIPTSRQIDVFYKKNLAALQRQADDLKRSIDNLPTSKSISIFFKTGSIPPINIVPPTTKKKKGYATGGPVWGGNTFMVGEKGPELFTAPANGQIIPNDKLGMGEEIHVHNYFGNQEMTHLIDTRVEVRQRRTAKTVRAGRRLAN